MTLAIGVRYPWGELNRLLRRDSTIPGAIILASDSRWTQMDASGNRLEPKDIGTKLFRLGSNVGAVYAGVSEVGERCLGELRQKLSRQSISSFQNSRELAKQTFQQLWKSYLDSEAAQQISPEYRCLHILVGACDKSGRAELYRFRYEADFEAETLTGPTAIGCDEPAKRLVHALEDKMREQVDDELSLRSRACRALADLGRVPPTFIRFSHVALVVGFCLNNIIQCAEDEAIGGDIQCAIMAADGFSLFPMAYTTDPRNEGPGWTKVTARPDQLETVTGTFGCYSLTDSCQ